MKLSYTFSCLLLCISLAFGQKKAGYKEQWQFPAPDSSFYVTENQQKELYATEEEMNWFKDAKLGIFVHWGPALLETNVLSWGRNGERPGAGKPANKGIDPDIYDNLYKQFNPVNFDADKWMQQVKDWGAEYIVFTAKHHDGFAFFDAHNTDYTIMHTPYGKDICKELADAAHKAGVKLFWYYSQPDWVHPDNLREKHYENYLPYMKSHIKQLFTEYGKIDGVFWDHLATKYWQWDSYHVLKDMKFWQPGLISNARTGFDWPLADRGDYDTPEQSLGPIDHHRYWEACLTMTDKWLYSPKGPIKSAETILGMLIQVAGNGGNLLLNLGPNGKGEFVAEEAAQARRVGDWIKEYGETLRNTRRGIYVGGDYGASTQAGDTLYIHVLQKFATNTKPVISLPALPVSLKSVQGVTPGYQGFEISDTDLKLYFESEAFSRNIDNIVKLVLTKNPENLERIKTWEAKAIGSENFQIEASSFAKSGNEPEVIYEVEGNIFSEGIHLKSWWQPHQSDQNPALKLHLNKPKPIETVLISENMRSHSVSKFELLSKDQNDKWSTIYTGNYIGEGLRIKLNGNPVYGIQLRILESKYQTQITAFNIYE
ncbi:alpha-L-fucosidase [Leeuwenhoekiella nanhaiensis]|uniref:alpha-L-fucosidase n=1 Tax=Leeuwenhoekiella nanhaiensis TaxID=1655491 RepID=A0A2G1VTH2_9FLAO|nr:alpha-L-fucosidase [Leeuwenhoekiella nanhaiensis]PHQ30082.1 hypothetical protein CJ305_03720 [Leeuwenhoekiella nanhaiensis]